MSFTASAIKKNRVTGVLIAVLLAAGLGTYMQMPRQTDPGFIVRAAQVVTIFPGASPERVEQLVTDKIEKVVQEIPELDFVTSQSRTGLSVVTINVREEYTQMQPIWDDLRRKVDKVRADLPDGIIGPNVNDEFGDVFGIMISISGDGFSYAEVKEVADEVRDELLHLPDVAKVDILGEQEERVFVEYDNAQLASLGMSPMALSQILDARNIIMPGGDINVGDERIVLEPTGNFISVEELRRTLIQVPGGQDVVYLGDIAHISRGYVDPPAMMVFANDEQALSLAVSMREGGNLVDLGVQVMSVYQNLPASYPHGIEFDVVFFEPEYVEEKVNGFVENVLQAVLIVLVVMLLTLGFRTGGVVATLIPTAMIIALLIMGVFDIWLDQVSLAALIIALGLLVDNAIVMSESIMVRMAAGESRFDAAVSSGKELAVPLLTSSLTTSAAFLPIYLAESSVGEYTAPLFTVVTITLLTSWALALSMTPLLCVTFLKVDRAERGFGSRFYVGYRRTILFVLRNRWASLLGVIAIFLGVMMLFAYVPKTFFPPQDRAFFMADFELAPGTPIERTREMSREIDAFIRDELTVNDERPEGITSWTSFVGASPPRFVLGYSPTVSEPHADVVMVTTSSDAINDEMIERLERFALERFPNVKAYVRRLGNGPPVTKPIQVRISARDTENLFHIVDQVKEQLASMPGVRNIGDDWGIRVKKLVVHVDEERARRAGVTNLDVALSLQTFLNGMEVTEYREDDLTIPVMMRSVQAERQDIDRLDTLNVFSQSTGQSVPIRQVANAELEFQPNNIKRRDRYRTVTVEAELEPGVTALTVTTALTPWLTGQGDEWGLGTRWQFGGEAESSDKANQSIADKMPIAGLAIIILLVWQFNSLRKPIIILTTIPLALIGVVIGLLVMDSYFGFMTLLGVVSLFGIVINNAIVLIDRIETEQRDNGLAAPRAVVEAAQRRLRPILLTTTTTIASLIPLYLGGGVMFEPMAVAIGFGLLFATFLTLGFVPLMYCIFYRVNFRGFDYDAGHGLPPGGARLDT